MAGHDVLGALDVGLEAVQRLQVGAERAAGADHRDLDRGQVVAHDEHARPRHPHRHAVGGVPAGRDAGRARRRRGRSGRAPAAPAASRAPAARAAHVVLVVELAQLALRRPVAQHRRRGLRHAERHLGTRSGRARGPSRRAWRAGRRRAKPDCSAIVGSSSSSSGSTGESMQNASSPRRTSVHVVCQNREVTTMTSACSARTRTQMPRSFSASLRFLTSSVGFLAPGSSSSPWRLTQITGTLSFTAGSTSW